MHRFLVTGGLGFIGSHYVRRLLSTYADCEVRNLDCLAYSANPANLTDLEQDGRYRLIEGDIASSEDVRPAMEGVDAVFNFAAHSHVDRSIQDAGPFVHSNVLGVQVLLDAARRAGTRRFIQISTDEVYGDAVDGQSFDESSPLRPSSPYSATKAAADLLVLSYVRTHGLPAIITRCTNNYGPFQFPEKLLPFFLMRLMRDESAPVYGDGRQVRDWLYVDDHCAAIDAVFRLGRVGEIYNISSGSELTNLDVTHALLDLLGKPASLIEHVQDRPGHDRRYSIRSSKIRDELGWRPKTPWLEGLQQTVEWYRDHAEWVETVRTGAYRNSLTRLARKGVSG